MRINNNTSNMKTEEKYWDTQAKTVLSHIQRSRKRKLIKTGIKGLSVLLENMSDYPKLNIRNRGNTTMSLILEKHTGEHWKGIAEIIIDPSQDDKGLNKLIHENGGVTGSYEYFIYGLELHLPSVKYQ